MPPRRSVVALGNAEEGHGTDVNDHFASILHEERMTRFRREGDAFRRAALLEPRLGRSSRLMPLSAGAVIALLLGPRRLTPGKGGATNEEREVPDPDHGAYPTLRLGDPCEIVGPRLAKGSTAPIDSAR
jgi:hypothetical protein